MKTRTNVKAGGTAVSKPVSKPVAIEISDYGFGVSMPVTTS